MTAPVPPKWMLIRHELYQSLISGEVAGREEPEVAVEKAAESTVKKVAEPTVKKVAESTVEKAAEPTVKKVAEPTVKKVAEEAEEEVREEARAGEEVQPRSPALRALQMMLAGNESIRWPADDLTLYGQSTGRSAAKAMSALIRPSMRADVPQKIILLILSKTGWKRPEYLAGGLGNVWKKVVKFRRENGKGSVARASRQNAVAKRQPAKLRGAASR